MQKPTITVATTVSAELGQPAVELCERNLLQAYVHPFPDTGYRVMRIPTHLPILGGRWASQLRRRRPDERLKLDTIHVAAPIAEIARVGVFDGNATTRRLLLDWRNRAIARTAAQTGSDILVASHGPASHRFPAVPICHRVLNPPMIPPTVRVAILKEECDLHPELAWTMVSDFQLARRCAIFNARSNTPTSSWLDPPLRSRKLWSSELPRAKLS